MINYLNQIRNLLLYRFWSFDIRNVSSMQMVKYPGDYVRITGTVRNNGFRLGTTYIIIKLIDPYSNNLHFNTDTDFSDSERQTLRIIDLHKFQEKPFCVDIKLPSDIKPGVLDMSVELWTPAKLWRKKSFWHYPYLFKKTPRQGNIEIIKPMDSRDKKVFISYSWDSPLHKNWVQELTQELSKHNIDIIIDQKDLSPGKEATYFMENATLTSAVYIAICSTNYVYKADNRQNSVGYETTILTNEILERSGELNIIPIIRDNPSKKRPRCFGSRYYVDMDHDNWKGESLMELVKAIRGYLNPPALQI